MNNADVTRGDFLMNAADYFAWWQYSGTGLGTTFPGEKYKQLHEELSGAGANVVIVCEFLAQNPDVIDADRWRRSEVLGVAHPAEKMQVNLTAGALEAVGARGAAKAVRRSKGLFGNLPPLSEVAKGAPIDKAALEQAMKDFRAQALSMFPEMARNLSDDVRQQIEQGATKPQQSAGAERREEIAALLDRYVAAHESELATDIEKHGDPRRDAGFDPERFLDEQLRQSERLAWFRHQRGELPSLREKLERLRKSIATEAPHSRRLQRARHKLMDAYRSYAGQDPEDLTADLQAWLRDVEQLRAEHPHAFQPKATQDDRINAKLAAIGEYEVDFPGGEPSVRWADPPGLRCDWTQFDLTFYAFLKRKLDPARLAEAYDKLIAEWERFRERFPKLEPELKQHVIGTFRDCYEDQLWEHEREDYEDENGQITDEKILENVEGGCVVFEYNDHEGARTSVHFSVNWDEEHGVDVEFTPDGRIRRYF